MLASKLAVFTPSLSRSFGAAAAELKTKLEKVFKRETEKIAKLKKEHGNIVVGTCTLEQAYGGMRDVRSMVYETSLLDPQEGIRFRGFSIPDLQKKLPKAPGGLQPLPEGLFWLLLTGELPTNDQVKMMTEEFHARSKLPEHTVAMINSFPKTMHPMTQFGLGILSMQTDSLFAEGYRKGLAKAKYWPVMLEDCLTLLGRLPQISAMIYRNTYKDRVLPAYDSSLDWAANMAHMMGFDEEIVNEVFRMYLTIHSDHEGGNVSAHTTHLVGSALSDAYFSLCGGMCGLAGPLHGLANQEVLRWVNALRAKLGGDVTKEQLRVAITKLISSGQVVPGYGHAVLRKTDPRYMCQREFCLKNMPNDPLFRIVSDLFEVTPPILSKIQKIKNPWPNVDAHSGVLLTHYGIVEEDFYTVMFGVSRALGVLAALVWSRALGLPIERPKSMTTEEAQMLIKDCKKGKLVPVFKDIMESKE